MSSNTNISDELLDNFCSVTGADKERARFYLEASNGDLEMAIGSFFEGDGSNEDNLNRREYANMNDSDEEEDIPIARKTVQPASSSKPKAAQSGGNSKFATISSMNRDEDDDEGDDEKGQAFYAGGSETSGQQILGPSKKNPEKIIKDLFEKAKEHGAQEVESNELEASNKKKYVVYGNGYRLGTGNEPTEVIKGPSRPKPPKVKVLKLWKNGFNVDEEPLRSYDDPKNKEFLESIRRGEPPRELLNREEGEVHLDMQDRRDEEYVPPKNKYVLFNDGYKLGSPTPTVVSNLSPLDQEANEKKAKEELKLDETKPATQIQIRLSNGSRLVIKANQTHKINDIRRYINTAKPEYSSRNYSLLMSFPNKELINNNETLSEAGALNAVLIQKLKE